MIIFIHDGTYLQIFSQISDEHMQKQICNPKTITRKRKAFRNEELFVCIIGICRNACLKIVFKKLIFSLLSYNCSI